MVFSRSKSMRHHLSELEQFRQNIYKSHSRVVCYGSQVDALLISSIEPEIKSVNIESYCCSNNARTRFFTWKNPLNWWRNPEFLQLHCVLILKDSCRRSGHVGEPSWLAVKFEPRFWKACEIAVRCRARRSISLYFTIAMEKIREPRSQLHIMAVDCCEHVVSALANVPFAKLTDKIIAKKAGLSIIITGIKK